MPKISVIIPIYNVEKKIKRCLDSLIAQTFTDFEVLLIDDGSPDRSGEICEEYAKQDSRFRVFHQENSGVSSARNLGIDQAKGKYVAFVDSDDYVSEYFLESLYNMAVSKSADITVCNYFQADEAGDFFSCNHGFSDGQVFDRSGIGDTIYSHIISCDTVGYYSLWNKLFRKQLMDDKYLRLNPAMSFGEDMIFVMDCLLYCKNIAFVEQHLYYYELTENGLFGSYRRSLLSDLLLCYRRMLEQTQPFNKDDVKCTNLNKKYFYYVFQYIHGIIKNETRKKQIIRKTYQNPDVQAICRSVEELDYPAMGLSKNEHRILYLIRKKQIRLATILTLCIYDDTYFLRKWKNALLYSKVIAHEKYCAKCKSFYWSYKIQGLFLIAPKSKILISKDARLKVTGVFCFNLCHDGKNNQPGTLYLAPKAQMTVEGGFRAYSGAYITVSEGARLHLSDGFINNNGKISCFEQIDIGKGVKISEEVIIRDSDNHEIIRDGFQKTQPIRIGDHVWIGLRGMILKGVTVGEGSVIAAGAVVTKDVAPHSTWGGGTCKNDQKRD